MPKFDTFIEIEIESFLINILETSGKNPNCFDIACASIQFFSSAR